MQYAWFIWSIIILAVWGAIYLILRNSQQRKEMLIVSAWTSLAGLTEPIFIPEYWNPPSLFDLAQRTGFDIEGPIFAFAVGGIASVLYERLFSMRHATMSALDRHQPRHRYHLLALLSAPAVFLILLVFTELNPIYATVTALLAGGIFTWYCRPDLKKKMFVSAAIFTAIYFVYFLTLVIAFPLYVESFWNLDALTGVLVFGIPLEELIFAFAFGFFWSSVYEHATWKRLQPATVKKL